MLKFVFWEEAAMDKLDGSFTIEVEIAASRDDAINLFKDSESFYKWQPNLISVKTLDKINKNDLEIMKMRTLFGKREIEIIRTVLKSDLPKMNVVTYELQGLRCLLENNFYELSNNRCRWVSNIDMDIGTKYMDDKNMVIFEMFKKYFADVQVKFKNLVEQTNNITNC